MLYENESSQIPVCVKHCFLFFSCEKTDRPLTGSGGGSTGKYTISGRFYQNCSRQPLANATLIFWQSSYGGGDLGKTVTDANGIFHFSYTPASSNWIDYGLTNQYGYTSYGKIVPYKNYSGIELFRIPTCFFRVSKQVYNNTYTNRDTLLIGDGGSTNGTLQTLKIPGPFTSGLLYEVPNYGILNYGYDGTYVGGIFYINNREFNQGNIKLTPCDTVNFVMEIR